MCYLFCLVTLAMISPINISRLSYCLPAVTTGWFTLITFTRCRIFWATASKNKSINSLVPMLTSWHFCSLCSVAQWRKMISTMIMVMCCQRVAFSRRIKCKQKRKSASGIEVEATQKEKIRWRHLWPLRLAFWNGNNKKYKCAVNGA